VSKRANGDGSVYERTDGRWCAAYYVPDSNGGETRKYVYGKDREEVRSKLTKVMEAVDAACRWRSGVRCWRISWPTG
jgi:integrase